jgi:DNA-binding transcriptional LysR family regulator
MPLELRDLRYFLAVADELQITRAAARLHVSQPTLSQAMERLERNVGASLLLRHSGGVGLTAAGEVLVAKATAALAAVDDAVAAVTANLPEPLAVGFLPPVHEAAGAAVTALRAGHGDLDVRWVALDYADQLSRLRGSTVDVAFVWAPYDDVDVSFAEVTSEAQVILMASDHPLASRPAVTSDDVGDTRDRRLWRSAGEVLLDPCHLSDRAGYRRTHGGRVPATIDETWALVASGQATALAPASVAQAYARSGVIQRRVVDAAPAVLAIAWRSADTRPQIQALVELAASTRPAR